jgi:hypothetical protein
MAVPGAASLPGGSEATQLLNEPTRGSACHPVMHNCELVNLPAGARENSPGRRAGP